jgi:hypothetical protein
MKRYALAIKGAVMGGVLTGGYLAADLMLPEPWGDYLLFLSLAVVNVGIGWRVGMLYHKLEHAADTTQKTFSPTAEGAATKKA